jgi:hypothetical protein
MQQRSQPPQNQRAQEEHDAKLKEHRRMLARTYTSQEEEKQKQSGEKFYRCERCGI